MRRKTSPSTVRGEAAEPGSQRVFACVLVWSADEPQRVGESLLIPLDADSSRAYVFGRGAAQTGDAAERLDFVRVRPGQIQRLPPVTILRLWLMLQWQT